jgi:hypothetical protein
VSAQLYVMPYVILRSLGTGIPSVATESANVDSRDRRKS